ncbi:glycosyltransferase [Amylibacter sp.]|nr:glycosyltransferase [Amylibacter sp.]
MSNDYNDFKNRPLVSVVMNCFNGERYLKEAIDSVFNQTYTNWEIIFWDNNSADKSSSIANSYGEKLIYYKAPTFTPLYEARNLAIDKCQGKVIAFLDVDDIWLPDKLERQMSLISSNNRIIYGGYEDIDRNGDRTGVVQDSCPSGFITSQLLLKNISQGSVLIDALLLKEYKFDERYHIIGDFDLWVRLSFSHKFKSIDGTVELSRQHDSNESNTKRYKWLSDRRYFYCKFLKSKSFLKYPKILLYIFKTELKGLIGLR